MTYRNRLVTTLVASTMLSAPAFAAEQPRYAPPAAWVAAPDTPLPPVTPATRENTLIQKLEMRLTPGKRDSFFDYAVRIANAEQLEEEGTVSFAWQPDRADLVIHRVDIVRDGKVIDLIAAGQKPTVIRREEGLNENSIDGTLTATLPVEGLRVGDVLRYAATYEEAESALGGATEGMAWLVAAPERIALADTRVIWPSDVPVRWRSFGQKVSPVVATKDGWQELTVKLPIAEQGKMPEDAPLRFRMAPQLEMSSFADWAAVSRTSAPLYATDGLIKEGGALAARIDQIAKATTDPRRRAGLALQMVQDDVRYLYTGLDNGNYVPQRPEDSWSLRYGDCKAKTLLLLAALRRLGISADAALVHTEQGDVLRDRLPSFGAFNHVIVRAEIGGMDYWLDGTLSGAHLEDLADVPAFSHALPVKAEGSELITLPPRAPARPIIAMALTLDQSAGLSLPALATIEMRFRGQMAAMMFAARDKLNDKSKLDMAAKLGQQFMENVTPLSAEIEAEAGSGIVIIRSRGIGDLTWDRSDGRPRLEIDQTLSDAGVTADRGRAAWRELPVEGEATNIAFQARYILPPGSSAFVLEGDQAFVGPLGAAQLNRTATLEGNIVQITDRITTLAVEMPAAELGQARDQIAKAKAKRLILTAPAGHPAPWQEVAAARKAGRLAPLEAAFAKAIVLQPGEAQPLLDRAYFLRQVYEPARAVTDFTAALELDRTASTLVSRGWAHDAGQNTTAAIDDMRAALELDPSHDEALTGEVYLLRFKGDFATALNRVEDRLASAGEDRADWIALRGHVQAESGDAAAGLADLDEANTLKPGSSHFLNERCWMKAKANVELESAVADCTRAIELADNASDILDSRGVAYFRLGRFDEALADFDAALKLNPAQSGSLFMRSLTLAQLGRKDAAARDLAGAKLQWPGVLDEYARHGLKP